VVRATFDALRSGVHPTIEDPAERVRDLPGSTHHLAPTGRRTSIESVQRVAHHERGDTVFFVTRRPDVVAYERITTRMERRTVVRLATRCAAVGEIEDRREAE
jgi:hypothetical protein